MKYLNRVHPKDAQVVRNVSEIPMVEKKWWRSEAVDETFPGGHIPIFFTFDESVRGILDKNVCIIPADKPWSDFRARGYYVCAKVFYVEKAKKKYSRKKGWSFVSWNGRL